MIAILGLITALLILYMNYLLLNFYYAFLQKLGWEL